MSEKIKLWSDFYINGICPGCKGKNIWLDEEGGEHESYVCKDCGIEVYIGMERVPNYAHMYDEKTDIETELLDLTDNNYR